MSLPFGGMFRNQRTTSDEADVAREDKRGGRSRAQIGVIGVVITALVVIVAMQMDKLPYLSPISTYKAYFDDAGGLVSGDIVTVSGVNVGTVQNVSLASTKGGTKAQVTFRMNDTVMMGIDSQAAIKTETVLGRRNLTILPHGPDRIRPGGEIPNENTIAPYSLTDALEGATDTLAETDSDQLNKALNVMSDTFSQTPDQVRGAVDGVARLSKSVADRDDALRGLLGKANQVTKIVGDRSEQINRLLLDANSLFGELQMRQAAIAQLISGTRDVSMQISGFIKDNNAQLAPVLTKLDGVLKILTDNESSLKAAIDELGPYANVLGEAVASGPYFSSLVGIPTFGDYTAVFMKTLQRKYPEIWKAFSYTNPVDPNGFKLVPGYDPNAPKPKAPKLDYPKAPASTPRQGG
ncbi:MCE family protein [Gordonia hankookensis]|uniref:MCE family protein n=1 Tax=Gordonia hankookensis TaxID=589403 RepID=A0ABR7W8L1_9ACTN|nr:MCE family protein [Gordonia hankookensis]MBD1319161.1 MCE family protein [Gordonia hankookensis]NDZ93497.1 MCE family protein [Streptomyces sp. SID11726]NEB27281.1 MCE family protein [Streptomyces sp. SID6673]